MKICLICVEIFAWGKYGGFGRATRTIGRELVQRGHEVTAIVPRRKGQKAVEFLDGIKVHGYSSKQPWQVGQLVKTCDADIYHSEEPSLATYIALKAMPQRKHVITFRDPREWQDWRVEFSYPSYSRWQVLANFLYEDSFLVGKAVRQADRLFYAAPFLKEKVIRKYRLKQEPHFLPTPVMVPKTIQKATEPTVCFGSRWDKRKRPELFFDLAKEFPSVQFIAYGISRNKPWEAALRKKYAGQKNLDLRGFVDQFRSNEMSQIMEKSWIFVNTAAREGLPNAFLEAAAHRCAILSGVNPDGFASEFGYYAKEGDFVAGLRILLEKNQWRDKGLRGFDYIQKHFEKELAINKHLQFYEEVLNKSR